MEFFKSLLIRKGRILKEKVELLYINNIFKKR